MIQSLINHLFIMTKSPWSDQSQGGASARRSLKPGSPGPSWGHGAVIAANGGDWNHGFLYVSIYIYIYILGMEKSSQLTKSMIFPRGRAKNHQPDRCLVFLSFIHWWCVFVCWTSVGTSKTTTWERWSRGPAAPGLSLRSLPLGLWSKPGSDSAIFLGLKLRIVWDHRMGGA